MITFASQGFNEPEKQLDLILTPSDVLRIVRSNLESIKFANEQYAEIAQLLEELAILERTAETKLRAWRHDPESFSSLSDELKEETHRVRRRLHDIFLKKHDYPNNPQIAFMPSDAYAHGHTHNELAFRNSEMKNLAHHIGMVASLEQELETYLTRQDGLEELEREAMIRDTILRIKQGRDHLTKILTGYYAG